MNQRKQNRTPWYSLGIALVLVVACLVTFTGTSLARFREERTAELTFVVGALEQIYLGKVVYPEETDEGENSEENPGEDDPASGETDGELAAFFEPSEEPVWEIEDGVRLLDFAVANGTSEESYAAKDQQLKIRLIGSLGLWDGTTTAKVTLYFPVVSDSTELETTTEENQSETTVTMQEVVATATCIKVNSPLYQTFGEGWIFTFLDADGEELYWTLDGGMLSFIEMRITVNNAALTEASLLKLQVIGETIQD